MEAMTALMIATVALTAFMGFVAYTQAQDPPEPEVSTVFLKQLRIEDGDIEGLPDDYTERECAIRGYCSMVIDIDAQLPDGEAHLRQGDSSEGCSLTLESGTFLIPADDGTSVMAHYEVAVFWR